MSDGLKAHHRAAIIATLAANHRVEKAVLFGSRAMGANTITSDVDIALFGRQLTLTDQAKLAAACEELPMAQSVDLVLYSTIDNPALVDHIRSHGVEWYRRGGGSGSEEVIGAYGAWQVVRLEQLASNEPGSIAIGPFGSRMKSSVYTPFGVPVIRGTNISASRAWKNSWVYVSNDFADSLPNCNAHEGDLVFPHRGSIGEVAIVPNDKPKYMISTSLMKFRPDPEKVSALFLFYYFRSSSGRNEIMKYSSQVGTPGIGQPLTSLRQFSVVVPPREEQKAIAHILGTLDDKIELNRQMNETLEAMAKTLFKSWFVDFDPVRAKAEGRSTGLSDEISALFPDSFEDSELGEIPRGWGVKRLEEYLELAYGKSLPAKSRRPGPVPVYGSGGVVGSHDVALTKGPTVIVGRKGTVGSLYLEAKPAFPIDTVFHILPRIGSMLFCYHLLACQPLSDMNTDAAVPGLNRGNVYRLKFPCPTSDLISAFDDMVGSLWKRQVANLGESAALAQVRDLLLPRLIGGGLRLFSKLDTSKMEVV
ncbi:MAG: restriction endonuclease subunit S [Cyanobacteria bacterium MAG CAR1_bin_15]|nr:restriction endonuclease subunit S [Cyanobacteria bacterium MAG CAR1_bin_15]